MQWNVTSIAFLVGAWLLGYVIGLVEMHLRQSRRVRRLEEELQRKEMALLDQAPTPRPGEALRLWFDEKQDFHLELDGSPLVAPTEMTAVQRKRLIELLSRLRPWLEGQTIRPTTTPPAPSDAIRPATPTITARPEQLATTPPTPTAGTEETPSSAESIIAQIDHILQRNLSGTALAGKVRLREQAGGGIEIWVNAKRYTSVDEVAEADAKAAIRAAIAEWERRS